MPATTHFTRLVAWCLQPQPSAIMVLFDEARHDEMADDTAESARQPVRRLHSRGAATRDKILRTAEEQFASRGLDGVSVRDITREANVDLALLNYHFGTKDLLFEAVIGPRVAELSEDRQGRVAALTSSSTVNDWVASFYQPVYERMSSGDPGWRRYSRIVAQMGYSDRYSLFRSRYLDGSAESFIEALGHMYPDAAPEALFWCYDFLAGNTAQILAGSDRLFVLSHGLCDSRDLTTAFHNAQIFATGGIVALLDQGSTMKASASLHPSSYGHR